MIRALIFDCFGVLYVDYGLAFYEKHIPNYEALKNEIMEIDKQADYGFISNEEHDRLIAELSGLEYEFIRDNVKGVHIRNELLMEKLKVLRTNYKVGMLSNVNSGGMDEFFSKTEQTDYFDEVVVSGDVGMIKPSEEIFEYMAAKLGVQPSECVMIDDRLANYEGAIRAGMHAVLYSSVGQTMKDLQTMGVRTSA